MPVSYIQHRIYSQLLYYHFKNIPTVINNNYFDYNKKLLLYDIHPNPGPKYSLQIGYTNIRSLFSDTNNTILIEVQDCKFNDMIKEFVFINNCDIIFLTETWLKDEEIHKYQLHINGYRNPIYKNRNTIGGGLLIYYKDNININVLQNLQNNNIEHMVIEVICSSNIKFIFNLIYRAPTNDINITDQIINNFYDCCNYSILHNYWYIFFRLWRATSSLLQLPQVKLDKTSRFVCKQDKHCRALWTYSHCGCIHGYQPSSNCTAEERFVRIHCRVCHGPSRSKN